MEKGNGRKRGFTPCRAASLLRPLEATRVGSRECERESTIPVPAQMCNPRVVSDQMTIISGPPRSRCTLYFLCTLKIGRNVHDALCKGKPGQMLHSTSSISSVAAFDCSLSAGRTLPLGRKRV